MFKNFFHKISGSIKEETARLRSVMHDQFDAPKIDPEKLNNHHK